MKRPTTPSPRVDVPDDASIAGEEDPGAALDTGEPDAAAKAPGRGDAPRLPRDSTALGAPDGRLAACNRCGGSGRYDGDLCPTCGGTGHVVRGAGSG